MVKNSILLIIGGIGLKYFLFDDTIDKLVYSIFPSKRVGLILSVGLIIYVLFNEHKKRELNIPKWLKL